MVGETGILKPRKGQQKMEVSGWKFSFSLETISTGHKDIDNS